MLLEEICFCFICILFCQLSGTVLCYIRRCLFDLALSDHRECISTSVYVGSVSSAFHRDRTFT